MLSLRRSPALTQAQVTRLIPGLTALCEARNYAQDSRCDPHVFALTVSALLETGLKEYDLRWLVIKGLLAVSRKVNANLPKEVKLRPTSSPAFTYRSRFILTEVGCQFARRLVAREEMAATLTTPHRKGSAFPVWDSQSRKIFFRGILVKHFRNPAPSQERLLNAFENAGWLHRIDNPFTDDNPLKNQAKLHEAIRRLNGRQRGPGIRFTRDGNGGGVCWESV